MKIVITNNSIMYNRGSEAVIRSVTMICRFWRPDAYIVVASGKKGEILKNIPDADRLVPKFDETDGFSELIDEVRDADFVIVTGADNYDYGKDNSYMRRINDEIFKTTKAKTILFDCSLSEDNLTTETIQDMSRFDYITVRESKTKELFERMFEEKKIWYYPDPAFVMPIEKCELPYGFRDQNTVGINISNLIMGKRVGAPEDIVIANYKRVVDYILKETDYDVLLLQHVMNNGFDMEAELKLYNGYEKEPRVSILLAESINAMQIKYIISKLAFLLTARTHASIAAYSMAVPTFVVGYSVKSVGIAEDIFGDWEKHVVKVKSLSDNEDLLKKMLYSWESRDLIKRRLITAMPDYKRKAMQFGELLMEK